MLLAVDIGNTQTAVGLFEGEQLIGAWRAATISHRTADELTAHISGLLRLGGTGPEDIDRVCLASVVPPAGVAAVRMVEKYMDADLLVVGPELKTDLSIGCDHPETVGADRLANAVAGFAAMGAPMIVVDFGTATTFDVVSSEAAYIGGAIAPGLETGAEALFRRAAGLSGVPLEAPKKFIGRTTGDGLKTGIIFGAAAMVDGIVAGIRSELGRENCPVIGTGGLVDLVGPFCRTIDAVEPHLTLFGLKRIWELNRTGTVA